MAGKKWKFAKFSRPRTLGRRLTPELREKEEKMRAQIEKQRYLCEIAAKWLSTESFEAMSNSPFATRPITETRTLSKEM